MDDVHASGTSSTLLFFASTAAGSSSAFLFDDSGCSAETSAAFGFFFLTRLLRLFLGASAGRVDAEKAWATSLSRSVAAAISGIVLRSSICQRFSSCLMFVAGKRC